MGVRTRAEHARKRTGQSPGRESNFHRRKDDVPACRQQGLSSQQNLLQERHNEHPQYARFAETLGANRDQVLFDLPPTFLPKISCWNRALGEETKRNRIWANKQTSEQTQGPRLHRLLDT